MIDEGARRVQPADNVLRLEEIKLQREQLALRQAELVADRPAKMLKVAEGFFFFFFFFFGLQGNCPPSVKRQRYRTNLAEGYMQMLQRIDMFGTAGELVIKDALMNGLGMMGGNSSLQKQLTGSQQLVATRDTMLTITEYLTLHYNKTVPAKELTKLGKEVAAQYRQEVAGEFPALDVEIEQKMQGQSGA